MDKSVHYADTKFTLHGVQCLPTEKSSDYDFKFSFHPTLLKIFTKMLYIMIKNLKYINKRSII